ncbi:MAG: Gfo/Idh/MocA family oxidoreductase [Bacteroidota bacterium]
MSTFHINRRQFLKSSSSLLALSALGAHGLDVIYPTTTKRIGLIGSGWYGTSDVLRLIQVSPVEVTAICDVDQRQLKKAGKLIQERQKSHKQPRFYTNYQQMLADEVFDLIIIGTPDHWHALQAIDAMKTGANLYLQKPISKDVKEGEAIVAAAQQYGTIIQIGTQRRSTPHLVEMKKKVIDAGLLGDIGHIEMCCYYHMRKRDKPPVQTVIPDHFDYDLWTGPAPMLPFRGVPHRWWRAFNAYGNGIVGDMCVHMLDTVRWLLDLGWPKQIHSSGGIQVQTGSVADIPDTQTATFQYGDFDCVWTHRSWGKASDSDYPWAFFIYGEKGVLKGSVHKYEFIPNGEKEATVSGKALYEREKFPEDVTEKGIELHVAAATRRHFLNLLESIETKTKPVADVMNGHISTASCILANLSMETGNIVTYDPNRAKVTDNKAANKKLAVDYRKPWKHPF